MNRYATKSVTLDGKSYNPGDIIPAEMGDRAGADKWSRLEGEAVPTPETPEIGITSESVSATADVQDEEVEEEETESEEEETPEEEVTEEETPTEETSEEAETTEEEETPKRGRRSRNK